MGRLRSRWCGGRMKRVSRSLTNEGRGTCSTSWFARLPEHPKPRPGVWIFPQDARARFAGISRSRIHRSRKEDCTTDDPSRPEIAEHLGGILERSLARNDRAQTSSLRQGDHPGEIGHRRGGRTEVGPAALDEVVRGDRHGFRARSHDDESSSEPEERPPEVEGRARPDEVDDEIHPGVRGQVPCCRFGLLRRHRGLRPRIEGRLPGFFPRVDREYAGPLDPRDLDRGESDASGSDDDNKVVLVRLAKGHDRSVGRRAAATEGSRDGRIQVRREREDRVLFRDDEFRVSTRRVEPEGVTFFAEVRPLLSALTALTARLLEVDDDPIAHGGRIHVSADFRNAPDDLVTGDERLPFAGLHLVEQVQVRVAHARREDLDDHVFGSGLWIWQLDQFHGSIRLEPNRTHGSAYRNAGENDLHCRAAGGAHDACKVHSPKRTRDDRRCPRREARAMDQGESMTAKVWQKPFALWVIAGGLVYMSIALLYLGLQFALAGGLTGTGGGLLAFLFLFIAVFLIAAGFSLREKRWAYVLSAAASIVLLLLFGSFIIDSYRNPADSGFWLSATGIPVLSLVILFSILAFWQGKDGLAQNRYLASPQSVGGLLTVAVIGFVIGSIVVGAIGAGVILRTISTGAADIDIVSGAATAAIAYSPQSFHLPLASGGKVTWINKDTTSHTVTSNQTGQFDSGTLGVGATGSHTFTTAGTYYYYCTIHPMMWGVVVVS